MSKITIRDWNKEERVVDFVGYNPDHSICYIYDEDRGKRSLILPGNQRCTLAADQHFLSTHSRAAPDCV